MKLVLRLLGAIWVSSLVIIAGFTLVQIQGERERVLTDLERRAGSCSGPASNRRSWPSSGSPARSPSATASRSGGGSRRSSRCSSAPR